MNKYWLTLGIVLSCCIIQILFNVPNYTEMYFTVIYVSLQYTIVVMKYGKLVKYR